LTLELNIPPKIITKLKINSILNSGVVKVDKENLRSIIKANTILSKFWLGIKKVARRGLKKNLVGDY